MNDTLNPPVTPEPGAKVPVPGVRQSSPTPAEVSGQKPEMAIQSPVKVNDEPIRQLTFIQALKHGILEDKMITKLDWNDRDYFGGMKDGILKLHKPDDSWHNWILNDGDLLGEDWIILN